MGRRGAEGPWPAGGSPGRQSSWPAARLAASVLCSCFLLTQAENIPVTLEPEKPQKGGTVTLIPGTTTAYATCSWYRGQQRETDRIITHVMSFAEEQYGPSYTGRETVGSECSLEIKYLTMNDSASYILLKTVKGGTETGRVNITIPVPPVSPPFISPPSALPVGVIVGIGIAVLASTVLIGVLVYYFVRRLRQGADQGVSMSSASPPA